MNAAKFKSRKLNLIEMIINLKDDAVVSQVEKIFNIPQPEFERFSKRELIKRVAQSEQDILNNETLSLIDLEELPKKW